MKKIKFIVSFIVMMMGLFIIGESYQLYLNNFNAVFSNTSLYLQENQTQEEMVKDVLNSARRNDVEVFAFASEHKSAFYKSINIYGSKGVEKYINDHLNVFEKEYMSILMGKTQIKFNEFNDIPNIDNVHEYNVIGSKENIHQFKMELIDKYAGNHPKDGYPDKESPKNAFFVWLLILIVILFLSFYDVMLQKKENFIKISLGEKVSNIIWKNILIDSMVFGGVFLVAILSLSQYNQPMFQFSVSLKMFLLLLLLNGILYLNLYFYDLKEVFSNSKISKKILAMNYVLKLVTVILTVLLISSNIAIVFESYKLYKQKPFFEEHAEYYYTNLGYKPVLDNNDVDGRLDEDAKVVETFYRRFFEKFDATALVDISYDSEEFQTMMANRNAFDYLSRYIKELKEEDLNKDFYLLLPKDIKNKQSIIENLKDRISGFEGDFFKYDYDVINYEDHIEIININEKFINRSDFVKNPVIIYNNINASNADYPIDRKHFKGVYAKDIMYKISGEEFEDFIEEFGLADQFNGKTNVLENYEYKWNIAKRVLYLNLVLSVLVLILEIIIIHSILRLEYEVNAIELSIKKILGYGVFSKNKKILLMTIISTVISILGAIIVGMTFNIEEIYYISLGGILILFIEGIMILFFIRKIEDSSLQKILKGGSL